METSSLATLSVESFKSGLEAAQVESFETARLLQLLFKAPYKRTPKDTEEIAVRLSGLACFSSSKSAVSCDKLAAFVEACPCPEYVAVEHERLEWLHSSNAIHMPHASPTCTILSDFLAVSNTVALQ